MDLNLQLPHEEVCASAATETAREKEIVDQKERGSRRASRLSCWTGLTEWVGYGAGSNAHDRRR